MRTTGKVARLIVNTTFEQLPSEAIQVAKGALLDGLGVGIAGSQTDIGRIVTRWAKAPMSPKSMTYPEAHTGLEGKFCLPYCLAVAVCDQRVGIRQFADTRVNESEDFSWTLHIFNHCSVNALSWPMAGWGRSFTRPWAIPLLCASNTPR